MLEFFNEKIIFYKTNEDRNLFLLNIDGVDVGVVRLDEELLTDNSFYINCVEIYYNYRNRGYGHILMREIERYAKQNNKKCLFLKVYSENTDAIKLYKDVGFETISNGDFIIEMEKNL